MTRPSCCFVLACALACAIATPSAAARDPDPGLKVQLESQKLNFEVDDDGDYKVVFDLGGGRTQLVWIRTPVENYGSLKVREIWSAGYKHGGVPLPADKANRLLEHSHGLILGGWTRQKEFAMFVVKIPADASPLQLRDAAEAAADCADTIEKEFTPGKDEL